MSISIELSNGCRLAEVKRISVHGLPGVGCYTLVINLHLSVMAPATDSDLSNLSIRVEWGDNQQRMIGTVVPDQAQPIPLSQHCTTTTIGFRLLLSQNQIEAIEALRNGGDILLSIWLIGNVSHDGNSFTIQERETFLVPQQEWIGALKLMGYCRSFLYELTLPYAENEQEPATALIKKAQDYLLRGDYDDCVGKCRSLLKEAYPLTDEDEKVRKKALEKYRGNQDARKSMDVPERMLALREAVINATHLAHHYNSGDGYSRDQARAILGATISIVSVFSESEAAK